MTVHTKPPQPTRASGDMAHLDFDDTAIAFRSRSSFELRKAQLLFKAFAYPSLVQAGPKLVNLALRLRLPVTPIIKTTIFDYFCGGVSIEGCASVVKELSRWGIGSILDYSVEGAEREADFEATTCEVLRVVERAATDPAVPFAVFKVTGIGRVGLLEKLSAEGELSADEAAEERALALRIERLCAAAHARGVRIMIDAEETWVQGAIDRYAAQMMRRFNLKAPIVYNTVQMYRVDRAAYLERLLAAAEQEGFYAGIKLVRGAYMEKERESAQRLGLASPIQQDKASTDRAFDLALCFLLDHKDRVGLVAGSHNEASIRLLADEMRARGLAADDRRFEFSQLLGMSDNLTYNLANSGFRASKYVPYGPVRAVLPYLFRRAEENTSIQGQAGRELQLIERELIRRAGRR